MQMTRRVALAGLGASALILPAQAVWAGPPAGDWEARVSLSAQQMRLTRNGHLHAQWPVSTARKGKVTPKGTFYPYWLSRHHRSSLYNNAPMPFSVFYSGNYAIHGTYETARLGSRASSGCVRLHTDNARFVFSIPETHGLRALRIVITA